MFHGPGRGGPGGGAERARDRQRVRQMLGRELRWRLVPVHLSLDVYEALQRMAPEGDVKRLIQETIGKLIQTT